MKGYKATGELKPNESTRWVCGVSTGGLKLNTLNSKGFQTILTTYMAAM